MLGSWFPIIIVSRSLVYVLVSQACQPSKRSRYTTTLVVRLRLNIKGVVGLVLIVSMVVVNIER